MSRIERVVTFLPFHIKVSDTNRSSRDCRLQLIILFTEWMILCSPPVALAGAIAYQGFIVEEKMSSAIAVLEVKRRYLVKILSLFFGETVSSQVMGSG